MSARVAASSAVQPAVVDAGPAQMCRKMHDPRPGIGGTRVVADDHADPILADRPHVLRAIPVDARNRVARDDGVVVHRSLDRRRSRCHRSARRMACAARPDRARCCIRTSVSSGKTPAGERPSPSCLCGARRIRRERVEADAPGESCASGDDGRRSTDRTPLGRADRSLEPSQRAARRIPIGRRHNDDLLGVIRQASAPRRVTATETALVNSALRSDTRRRKPRHNARCATTIAKDSHSSSTASSPR